MRARIKNFSLSLSVFLVLVLCWEGSTHNSASRQFLFGSPTLLISVARKDLSTISFWWDILITFSEALLGLLVGTTLGTACGVTLWMLPRVSRILSPYIASLGAIPIFAISPMITIWFGTGYFAKIAIVTLSTLFVSMAQALHGATHASGSFSSYGDSLGVSRSRLAQKVVLPGAYNWILEGIKLNIGLAFTGALLGEFLSSEAGLGHYIFRAGALYDTPRILLGVTMLATISAAASSTIRWRQVARRIQ